MGRTMVFAPLLAGPPSPASGGLSVTPQGYFEAMERGTGATWNRASLATLPALSTAPGGFTLATLPALSTTLG